MSVILRVTEHKERDRDRCSRESAIGYITRKGYKRAVHLLRILGFNLTSHENRLRRSILSLAEYKLPILKDELLADSVAGTLIVD